MRKYPPLTREECELEAELDRERYLDLDQNLVENEMYVGEFLTFLSLSRHFINNTKKEKIFIYKYSRYLFSPFLLFLFLFFF